MHFHKQIPIVNPLHYFFVSFLLTDFLVVRSEDLEGVSEAVERLQFENQKLQEYLHVLFVADNEVDVVAVRHRYGYALPCKERYLQIVIVTFLTN